MVISLQCSKHFDSASKLPVRRESEPRQSQNLSGDQESRQRSQFLQVHILQTWRKAFLLARLFNKRAKRRIVHHY